MSAAVLAHSPPTPDWSRLENETMQHFQALLRLHMSNPRGNEKLATDTPYFSPPDSRAAP